MKLSVPERLSLLNILSTVKGTLITLRVVQDLATLMGFSDDEVREYELRQEGNSYIWKSGAASKDIEIGETGRKILAAEFEKLGTSEEMTLQLLPLAEKFISPPQDIDLKEV